MASYEIVDPKSQAVLDTIEAESMGHAAALYAQRLLGGRGARHTVRATLIQGNPPKRSLYAPTRGGEIGDARFSVREA